MTRSEYHRIDAPSLGGSAEIGVHGHWGRPVLWFPSEGGTAGQFEEHGMLDALRPALDDGRITVFCVDSYDWESWSAQHKSQTDRARAHRAFEDWIVWRVVPFIRHRCAGRDDIATAGPSLGAFHAVMFALRHAHLFGRAVALSGAYDPWRWQAWGEGSDEAYLTDPFSFLPGLPGGHLDHLRQRLFLTLVVGSGMWEDSTGANASTRALDRLLTEKQIGHELFVWGQEWPHDWVSWRAQAALYLPHWDEPDPGTPARTARTRMGQVTARPDSTRHLIGLLLGTEDDWPRAFEELTRRLGPVEHRGRTHELITERITIEPFDLRAPVRHDVVIDRLAWWYFHPREWLKKAALVNDTYLLNNPFTFQAMEKHSAYCAMIRLGFDIPPTALVPYKNPVDHEKWTYTAQTYNLPFELDEVAETVGYPMYMKPFDGGAWRGVTRVDDVDELHRAYDASGQMLMHLQAAVSPFDSFARSLTIGPETKIMKFRPELPMHDRYEVAHSFLPAEAGMEILTLSRTINAFFRWEFNSCEALVAGTRVQPIDYANACPDIAITSLHYYFPWAITQLISWSAFCAVTRRTPQLDTSSRVWFDIADDPDLSFSDKLGRYGLLADQYFQADEYREFCATSLASLPDLVLNWVDSVDFDDLLVETVRKTYPAAEHDRFIGHFRGLMELWVADQR